MLVPGRESNFEPGQVMNCVYFTATLDAAVGGAEFAAGEGRGRIYIVEPRGEFEDDPNVTDKKLPWESDAVFPKRRTAARRGRDCRLGRSTRSDHHSLSPRSALHPGVSMPRVRPASPAASPSSGATHGASQVRSPASISASAWVRSTVGAQPHPCARSAKIRPVHAGASSQTGSTPRAPVTVSK